METRESLKKGVPVWLGPESDTGVLKATKNYWGFIQRNRCHPCQLNFSGDFYERSPVDSLVSYQTQPSVEEKFREKEW